MIHDFCGGLEEELLRTNFILVYELIDELIVQYYIKSHIGLWLPVSDKCRHFKTICDDRSREMLFRHFVMFLNLKACRDYLWQQLSLDKLRLSDSITEKESVKSIQKNTNDIFAEIQEKLSAVFNVNGFAIYIKINGMLLIKNYVHNRLNLRI